MSIEAGGYISDLVATNPPGTDPKSQGDDHIRLVKAALQQTFPNASRIFRFPASVANNAGNYTVVFPDDMGKIIPINAQTAARTVSLPTPSGANADGFRFTIVKADHANLTVTISGGTINGETSLVLYQRYQKAEFFWSAADSVWFAYVDPIVPIGAVAPWPGTTAPTGWLLACQLTIGSAASAANSLASAATRGLFYHLWSNFSNTICPVSGGRGASAQADFDGSKTIQLLDMRGRGWIGLDNLGGTDAGLLGAILNGNTLGEAGGTETNSLTTSHMPAHTHPGSTVAITDPGHSHAAPAGYLAGTVSRAAAAGGSFNTAADPLAFPADAAATTGITATPTIASQGSGSAFSLLNPVRVGGWIIKY